MNVGEIKLWRKVLDQAKLDLVKTGPVKYKTETKNRVRYRQQVIDWIGTADFKTVVSMAALDYDTVLGEFEVLK